jgi:hypothetical protein
MRVHLPQTVVRQLRIQPASVSELAQAKITLLVLVLVLYTSG